MTGNRWPLATLVAVVASVLALSAALASSAAAFHIPGATYTGTLSGGGAVILDVSPGGTAVTRFRVENYPTPFCGTVGFLQQTGNIPIVNNSFSGGSSFFEFSYTGSFSGVQLAQGTFTDDECGTGTLTWTARTTASPAGSAECVAAQAPVSAAEAQAAAASAQVTKAKTALRNAVRQARQAKKAVKRAATAAAKRKARKRLRKASRKRAAASRQLSQAKAQRTQAQAALQQALAARAAVCEPAP